MINSLGFLSHFYHNGPKGERIMVALRSYFDASFTMPSGITSIGGYIGTDEEWRATEYKWAENLQHWGLNEFHLSELTREIGHEKAGLCAASFARIIGESNLWGISAGVVDSDFNAFYGRKGKAGHISTYHLCLEITMELIAEYMNGYREKGDRIAIIIDNDWKSDEAAKAIFEYFRAVRNTNTSLESLSIAFNKYTGLQFADLNAGVWRQQWLKDQFSSINPEFSRDIESLGEQTLSALWNLENLKDFGVLALRRAVVKLGG